MTWQARLACYPGGCWRQGSALLGASNVMSVKEHQSDSDLRTSDSTQFNTLIFTFFDHQNLWQMAEILPCLAYSLQILHEHLSTRILKLCDGVSCCGHSCWSRSMARPLGDHLSLCSSALRSLSMLPQRHLPPLRRMPLAHHPLFPPALVSPRTSLPEFLQVPLRWQLPLLLSP